MNFSQFALPIAASATKAYSGALLVGGQPVIALEIDNQAATNVNEFVVQAKDHEDGEWYDYLTSATLAGAAGGNILFVSAVAPGATAASTKTHVHFRSNGVRYLRFGAKLASGTGTVHVRGSKIDL